MTEIVAPCEQSVRVPEVSGTRCPNRARSAHEFPVRHPTPPRPCFALRGTFWRFAMVNPRPRGLHWGRREWSMREPIHIIGGGLAGSEAAWQLAERGHDVVIHEMRPMRPTPAHKTDRLAELVCSNTFKSTESTNAHGLLKAEMRVLGSLILDCA